MSWKLLDPVPEARHQPSAVYYRNRIYIFGGLITPSTWPLTVWSARLDVGNEGIGQPWDTVTATALPMGAQGIGSWVDDDQAFNSPDSIGGPGRIWTTGGTDGGTTQANINNGQNVLLARINSDGTITSWLQQSPLPIPLSNHAMWGYRGFLYVAGGNQATLTLAFTTGTTAAPTVGQTLTGGTSGATSTLVSINITSGTFAGGTAVGTVTITGLTGNYVAETVNYTGGHFAIAAGQAITYVASASIYRARVMDDGTIGTWSQLATSLPETMAYCQAVIAKDFVYVYDGQNIFWARQDINGDIDIPPGYSTALAGSNAPWIQKVLPLVRNHAEMVLVDNKIVLLGGYDGGNNEQADCQIIILEANMALPDQRQPVTTSVIPTSKSDGAVTVDYQNYPRRIFFTGGSTAQSPTATGDFSAGAMQRDGSV